jgi:hypothetical protein
LDGKYFLNHATISLTGYDSKAYRILVTKSLQGKEVTHAGQSGEEVRDKAVER